MEETHHQYQTTVGLLILFIRLFLFALFAIGIFRSLASSAGAIRRFLKIFGLIGSVYFLCWPVMLLFCTLFLPYYMHHEVVTISDEAMHLMAIAFICHMLSIPGSYYRRVSLKDEDDPLSLNFFNAKK